MSLIHFKLPISIEIGDRGHPIKYIAEMTDLPPDRGEMVIKNTKASKAPGDDVLVEIISIYVARDHRAVRCERILYRAPGVKALLFECVIALHLRLSQVSQEQRGIGE